MIRVLLRARGELMTGVTRAIRASSLSVTAVLFLAAPAPQVPSLARGQSVYVVAVRDTNVLTRCPPTGRVSYTPPASPGTELVPAWAEPFPGVPDRRMREYVEQVIRRQNRFKVAPSAEAADLVFIVNGQYRAALDARVPGRGAGVPDGLVISVWIDSRADVLFQVYGIAVPAAVYRQDPTDLVAIGKARIWEGIELSVNAAPVSPESLARAFASGRGTSYRSGVMRPDVGPQGVCTNSQPPRARRLEVPQTDRTATLRPTPGAEVAEKPAAPSRPLTFRSDALAVVVPVVATDDQGQPVGDLRASEFRIFEDDVERQLEGIIADTEPLTAALLIDTSYSVQKLGWAFRDAALDFVNALRPEDRVLVASFDSRVYILCEATTDRDEVGRAIVRTRLGGSTTRLYDALDTVTAERVNRATGRRAIVLVTDGMDSGSGWVDEAGALDQAQSSNVPVYVVQVDAAVDAGPQFGRALPKGAEILRAPEGYFNQAEIAALATRYLNDLASTTGGQLERARTPHQMIAALRRVADEFKRQYLLYYYPSDTGPSGSLHGIRVTVNRPGVTVKTRAAWRAPAR